MILFEVSEASLFDFFSFFLSPVLMRKHTSVIYPTACTFWPILRTSVLTSNQLLKKWKQCRGPSVWCLLATSLEELISVGSAVVSAQRKMLLNSLFYSFIQQLSYSLSFLFLLHLRRTSLDFFFLKSRGFTVGVKLIVRPLSEKELISSFSFMQNTHSHSLVFIKSEDITSTYILFLNI